MTKSHLVAPARKHVYKSNHTFMFLSFSDNSRKINILKTFLVFYMYSEPFLPKTIIKKTLDVAGFGDSITYAFRLVLKFK